VESRRNHPSWFDDGTMTIDNDLARGISSSVAVIICICNITVSHNIGGSFIEPVILRLTSEPKSEKGELDDSTR